jgi:hypothetical protein
MKPRRWFSNDALQSWKMKIALGYDSPFFLYPYESAQARNIAVRDFERSYTWLRNYFSSKDAIEDGIAVAIAE